MKTFCLKADLFGKDINKKGTPQGDVNVPETLGLASALVFLCLTTIGILYQSRYNPDFVLAHIAAILTISFAVHLGFCDDVFDLK